MLDQLRGEKLQGPISTRFKDLRGGISKYRVAIGATIGLALSAGGGYTIARSAGMESGASGSSLQRERQYEACIPLVPRFTESERERPVVRFGDLSRDGKRNCEVNEATRRLSGELEAYARTDPILLPSVDDLEAAADIQVNNAEIDEQTERVLGAGVGGIGFVVVGGLAFLISEGRKP